MSDISRWIIHPEFIQHDEDILPGIRPGVHRDRTLEQIISNFKYQRQYLYMRHERHTRRVTKLFGQWHDPFMRAVSVQWTEQHCRFYQPQQRLLLGLFLSAARMIGVRSLMITADRLETPDDGTIDGFPVTTFLAMHFAELRDDWDVRNDPPFKLDWLNYQHRGWYDLADPEMFRKINSPG